MQMFHRHSPIVALLLGAIIGLIFSPHIKDLINPKKSFFAEMMDKSNDMARNSTTGKKLINYRDSARFRKRFLQN